VTLQVTFKGDGILGGIQVIADAHGNVKGKVGNPAADPPLRPDGKLNVGGAVGRGRPHYKAHWQASKADLAPEMASKSAGSTCKCIGAILPQ